jgi:hypothetical protein
MSEPDYPESAGAAEPERHQPPGEAGVGSEGAASSSDIPEAPLVESDPPAPTPTEEPAPPRHERAPNMLPGRVKRAMGIERLLVRIVATGGVIGIGVGVAAILAANHVQGWIIGLVVSGVSVLLSAVLWSSRQL